MSALALSPARPAAVRLARIPADVFGIFVCLLSGLTLLRPALDPDLGWHLRTGELILASGKIPTADPYSFTVAGAPWVEHEWLWQVAAAWIRAELGIMGRSASRVS